MFLAGREKAKAKRKQSESKSDDGMCLLVR